jgi:hypothetical protein
MSELTEDEHAVLIDLWRARMRGRAIVVENGYVGAAHSLTERGWCSRRIENDDLVWELSDQGLTALELGAMRRGRAEDMN